MKPTTSQGKKRERKENRLESVDFVIYESFNPTPREKPLFIFKGIFRRMDMKRLKSVPNIELHYELKERVN